MWKQLATAAVLLVHCCSCCHTAHDSSWIEGEWRYNAADTMKRDHGHRQKNVSPENWKKVWESSYENNANDHFFVSQNKKYIQSVGIRVDLVEESCGIDAVTFRGLGENEIGVIVAKRVAEDRVDLTLKLDDDRGNDETDLGLFDRVPQHIAIPSVHRQERDIIRPSK